MASDRYGSARWAEEKDLKAEGVLTIPAVKVASGEGGAEVNRAFLLGCEADAAELTKGMRDGYNEMLGAISDGTSNLVRKVAGEHRGRAFLGWAGDGHVLTVAPTRSGKGVGLVIPNLLHYPGSVIVIDPKGENYAVTHRYRSGRLKQRIVCIDPFHVVMDKEEATDSINPLDGLVDYSRPPSTYLKQNPELLDEVGMIADSLVVRPADEKDPHWNDKCRTLLKGLILAVVYGLGPKGRRHLSCVRSMLTAGLERLVGFLPVMESFKGDVDGALGRAAREIRTMGREEFKNVISFALKHTEFMDSPLVGACLGREEDGCAGTYDLRNLKTKGGVTIYLILPPHYLTQYGRLFRLWVTMAMASMTRTIGKPKDGCPVLFILDEMAQLGTMDMMRKAVSLLAGYGMSVWMIWQDLSQLKSLYKEDWPSFIANAKIQQFFGINDHETAKYISEMLGEETIRIETKSESSSISKERFALIKATKTKNKSKSDAEKERSLLNPDEVRRLNREAILMFVQGVPPIVAERITYYTDPVFAGRYDRNPYV